MTNENVNRRGFLSLLVATPLIPALAKLESVIHAPPPVPLALPAEFHLQRYVMPFGDGSLVKPGGVVRYAARMQRVFRPERIMMPSSSLHFGLLGVSSAGEPNLDEEISAELFNPLAYGMRLELATVAPGEEIVIAAVNRGSEPAPFHLALMGDCIVSGPPPKWGPEDYETDDESPDDLDPDDFDDEEEES